VKVEPRRLSDAERRILAALLGPEFDGVRALREQAEAAEVVGRCDCGCPTVELRTGGPPAVALHQRRLSPVEGRIASANDEPPGEILLFLEDGRLASMEFVYYTSVPPDVWPDLDKVTVIQRQD
jgi:hypothetical protein